MRVASYVDAMIRSKSAALVRLPLALALLSLACRPAADHVQATAAAEAAVRIEISQLPSDWNTSARSRFEKALSVWSPEGLSDADLATLHNGLGFQGQVSVRAALLLAHAASGPTRARALEILIGRLGARQVPLARSLDAGDVVAAAALAAHTLSAQQLDGLSDLAIGDHHPDLEVRVELASTCVRAGRSEVVPFLLRVLRAMTPDERLDPPDWERKTTMAWAKSRAAEALSESAGVPCTFVSDASFADQEREADQLAAHWGL